MSFLLICRTSLYVVKTSTVNEGILRILIKFFFSGREYLIRSGRSRNVQHTVYIGLKRSSIEAELNGQKPQIQTALSKYLNIHQQPLTPKRRSLITGRCASIGQ